MPLRPTTAVTAQGSACAPSRRQNNGELRYAHVTCLWLSHPLDDPGRNREQVTPCPEVLTIERTKRVKSNSRRRPCAGILEKWMRSSCSRPAPGLDHTGPTATLW